MFNFAKAFNAIEALATDAIPIVAAVNPAYGAMALAANTALRDLVQAIKSFEAAHPEASTYPVPPAHPYPVPPADPVPVMEPGTYSPSAS